MRTQRRGAAMAIGATLVSAIACAVLLMACSADAMMARTSAEPSSINLALQAGQARMAFDQRTGLYSLTLSGVAASLSDSKVHADRSLAQVISKACRAKHLKAALATPQALQGAEAVVTLNVWSAKWLAREGLLELQVWPTSVLGPRDSKSLRRTKQSTIATKLQAWSQGATSVRVAMEVPTHLASEVQVIERPHVRALQQEASSLFGISNPAYEGDCSSPDFGQSVFIALIESINSKLIFSAMLGVPAANTSAYVIDQYINILFNGSEPIPANVSRPFPLCYWNALATYALADAPLLATEEDYANVSSALQEFWPVAQAYLALPDDATVADKGAVFLSMVTVLSEYQDAFIDLASATDGTEAAGLVLLVPYSALVLNGMAYLVQNAPDVPALAALMAKENVTVDDLASELQDAITRLQYVASQGVTQLGDLSDLYSDNPHSDTLIATAFQNLVAISKNVQMSMTLMTELDPSAPGWTTQIVLQTVTSPILGAWLAWEPATVDALAEHGVSNDDSWNISDVTGMVVKSAGWVDAEGCITWGVTSLGFFTDKGNYTVGANVAAGPANCTSCYRGISISAAYWEQSEGNFITSISGEYTSTNPNLDVYHQFGLTKLTITTSMNQTISSSVRGQQGLCSSQSSSFSLDLNTEGLAEWSGRAWVCGLDVLPARCASPADGMTIPFLGPMTLDGCYGILQPTPGEPPNIDWRRKA